MSELWVVIDVGCHECGVSSEVVGSYLSEADAALAAKRRDKETRQWREGGQTLAQVFKVPTHTP